MATDATRRGAACALVIALGACSLPPAPGTLAPDAADSGGDDLADDAPPSDVPDAFDVTPDDAPADAVGDPPTDVDADADDATDATEDATDVDTAVDVRDAEAPGDASVAMDAPDADAPDAPPDVPDAPDATPDACVGAACPYASCADLPRGSTSGVYTLRGTGGTTWRGYCLVNADNSPAWTLVMKVDGARATFQYDSAHWETLSRLDDGVADLSQRDAKYEGYNATPVRQILLYTSTSVFGERAQIATVGDAPAPRVPLLSLMQMRPPPVMTVTGLNAWTPIFPDARLQRACQRFGFNVNPQPGPMFARVRIGGVGDESDAMCSSPDSWVGVGGFVNYALCGSAGNTLSAGNVYGCDGANPARRAPSFTWIYVR